MLRRLLLAASLGLACFSVHATESAMHDHAAMSHQAQGLAISNVWSRAMPVSSPTGAVYFVLDNQSPQADRLIGAQTPRAGKAELHAHVHAGGVMRMEHVANIEVPAHGQVEFKPGGYHVMLFELNQPLVAGERFPLTLEFEHGGKMETEVQILNDAPQMEHTHR